MPCLPIGVNPWIFEACMSAPSVAIITGYGINSDLELAEAFRLAGAHPTRIHVGDLIAGRMSLRDFDILGFPGGFSFGDHIASGRVFANKLRSHLGDQLLDARARRVPMIGICNGFQVLVKLGLLPGANAGELVQTATLTTNDSGRFEDRWCTLQAVAGSPCLWTRSLETVELPVRHGEGKFIPGSASLLASWKAAGQVCLRYVLRDGTLPAEGPVPYPANPNGAVDDVAGVCTPDGLVFGLMPHPEAHIFAHHHPRWQALGLKGEGAGMTFFRNAVAAVR
jgi:phosphoribosylformylglycinamidine synthase subunit PurQ / glutaminase